MRHSSYFLYTKTGHISSCVNILVCRILTYVCTIVIFISIYRGRTEDRTIVPWVLRVLPELRPRQDPHHLQVHLLWGELVLQHVTPAGDYSRRPSPKQVNIHTNTHANFSPSIHHSVRIKRSSSSNSIIFVPVFFSIVPFPWPHQYSASDWSMRPRGPTWPAHSPNLDTLAMRNQLDPKFIRYWLFYELIDFWYVPG